MFFNCTNEWEFCGNLTRKTIWVGVNAAKTVFFFKSIHSRWVHRIQITIIVKFCSRKSRRIAHYDPSKPLGARLDLTASSLGTLVFVDWFRRFCNSKRIFYTFFSFRLYTRKSFSFRIVGGLFIFFSTPIRWPPVFRRLCVTYGRRVSITLSERSRFSVYDDEFY